MIALAAALLAASNPTPVLEASVPWFERITVTVDDKGAQQSCRYQFSLSDVGIRPCAPEMAATLPAKKAAGGVGAFSKLTFERRFNPGDKLNTSRLQPGDKLLGQQVMYLTFADDGAIATCEEIGSAGDMVPAYGCDQAKEEQFRLAATAAADGSRTAFMTIVIYGHQEQIV